MRKPIQMGSRWQLLKHPYKPICKVTGQDHYADKVNITWEDDLKPKNETYDMSSFYNGDFVEVEDDEYGLHGLIDSMYGGFGSVKSGSKYCDHTYVEYTGLNESYEYCTKCDKRKE